MKALEVKETTITAVSRELGVSRPTIYAWFSRYKRFGLSGLLPKVRKKQTAMAHNRTSPEVETLVRNIARTYWQDGVETLHDWLEYEHNISLHPTTIYRILKRGEVRYEKRYIATAKRWKKKLFSHQIAGKELQMDTKYPYGYQEGKVIYTIIDDATRRVFA